jgi:hypothetical protein
VSEQDMSDKMSANRCLQKPPVLSLRVAAQLLHKGSVIIQGVYLCFTFYLQTERF